MVHFSIALPLNREVRELDGSFVDPSIKESFGVGWIRGRYNGTKRIEIAEQRYTHEGSTLDFVAPRNKAKGSNKDNMDLVAKYFDHTPRAFHEGALRHFKPPLRWSVGAYSVDTKSQVSDPRPIDESNDAAIEMWKFPFAADITVNDNEYQRRAAHYTEGYDNLANQPAEPLARFRLNDDPSHPYSAVALLSVEYLSYEEPTHHKLQHEEDQDLATHFLVLHVAVENCSSRTLDAASNSLQRPRNLVDLKDYDADCNPAFADLDQRKFYTNKPHNTGYQLLNLFTEHAFRVLPSDFPRLNLTPGGYLEFSEKTGTSDDARLKPFRTVCAIPGIDAPTPPRLLPSTEADVEKEVPDTNGTLETEDIRWSTADKWGWVLSTGADDYYTGILNDRDRDSVLHSRVATYKYWTLHSSPEGLAVVRRSAIDKADSKMWTLTSTRFMDVALLNRRAERYMRLLSNSLRDMKFETAAAEQVLRDKEESNKDLTGANQELRRSLARFDKLQNDFLVFRDRLWFDTVAGNMMDTLILNALQESTGTRAHFDDIYSELELRKSIYATRYQSLNLGLGELRERRKDQENDMKERRNQFIGLAAVIVAVPPIVQMFPLLGPWGQFGWSIAIMAAGVLYITLRWRGDRT